MVEKFFWADALADKIINQKGNKKQYVCASGITPSGQIHVGNFREVITTDMVVRALENKGKKVRFIYSWDDFDRFRKVPKGLPKNYEKYLGMPLSEIPAPENKNQTYAQYNEKKFENSLKKVFIKPEFIYQNKMNKNCVYSELIKTALENKKQIMEILNKYRKEPLKKDWQPITIYCEKCKKDSTKIISIKNYQITYKCQCGFENIFDFRKKGIVSIKWRVDWPLRWKYEQVDFEPGGIDHSVYGGSFTTSKEISKKIFNFEPPVYQFYEWIGIKGGKAFSSSTGNALSLEEVEAIYQPEILRYLFVGTKPKSAFQISFDNDVINRYEQFDTLEKKYFGNKCSPKEKRMYEMSVIEIPKTKPNRTSFRHLITLVQINKTKNLNKQDKERAEKVKNWLQKYAEDDMKFELQKKINIKLNEKQKKIIQDLKTEIQKSKTPEELFNKFYEICKKNKIPPQEFFKLSYQIIIGKSKGPRLAELIFSIGKNNVIKLWEK